jgi:hypothetical protein
MIEIGPFNPSEMFKALPPQIIFREVDEMRGVFEFY